MKQSTRSVPVPNALLRRQREQRHWSQTELARMLGSTYLSVCRWENGTTSPSLYYRKRLCEIFEMRAEELGLGSSSSEAKAGGKAQNPPSTDLPVWSVPYRRNPFFTGRDYVLARLQALLNSGRATALSQVQAISGLGGIGKTQTAVEYAYRHRHEYQAVLWARAESREVMHADLLSLAESLELPERLEREYKSIVTAVKRWLGTHSGWLLILDNVEELTLVEEIAPIEAQGHILLTTRAQSTGMFAQRLDLEQMDVEEGALFLLRRAKLLSPDAPLDAVLPILSQHARDICSVLAGLPLALDQAGAYIEETGCSPSDYLERYHTKRASLLNRRGQRGQEHPDSVSTTVSLSCEKVQRANPAAVELLDLCAFLSPDAIPEELLTRGAPELGLVLEAVATNPLDLDEALAVLRTYSLVRRNSEARTLTLHRLVQAVLKDAMDEQTRRQWARRCVMAVNRTFPAHDGALWQHGQRFFAHVQACVALIADGHMSFLEAGQLLGRAGHYLMDLGQYQQAETLLVQALALHERHLGLVHPAVAQSLTRLGELKWHQGKLEQAEPLRKRALEIWEQTLGLAHPDVAGGLNDLAMVYREQGRSALAEPLFVRARGIYELLVRQGPLTEAHCHDMVACNENLAILYVEQGQFAQAEPLLLQSLALSEQVFGTNPPHIAFTYHNLAFLYEGQGEYAQAELWYKRALASREEKFGLEHPDTAATLHNLARLYQMQGHYAQAQPLFQRALSVREKMLGPEHPRVAHTLTQLALLLNDLGEYTQAKSLLNRSLAIRERGLGPSHPEVAWNLEALALVYEAQSRFTEAEQLVTRALTIYDQQPGTGQLEKVESLVLAGILCYKQERYAEAEQFLQLALGMCEQRLGDEHLKTARCQHELATLSTLQGRYDEAEALFRHALSIREQKLGAEHPDVVTTRRSYGALLAKMRGERKTVM